MRVKIKIPKSQKDIRLSQYQKFFKKTEESEDANYINRMKVAIFCNLPDKAVNQMYAKDFEEVVNHLDNVLNEVHDLQMKVKHEGTTYGFIPNIEMITAGEEWDAETYMSDVKDYDKLMSVLYRPITYTKGDTYLIEEYTAQEKPLDLNLDIVTGAIFFFQNLLRDCVNAIKRYLKTQVKQDKKLLALEQNGVGILQSINSLEEIYSDMMKLPNYQLTKPYSNSVTMQTKTG